jgi:hypothetical protein
MSIFVVQKATAPKSGVEFRQGSIGTIRGSLAMSYDVWRRRARQNYAGVGWVVGWVVPGTFYSHFVVQLANLQDSSIAEIPKLDRVWQQD